MRQERLLSQGGTERCLDLSVFLSSAALLFSPLLLRALLAAFLVFSLFPQELSPFHPLLPSENTKQTPLGPGLFGTRGPLPIRPYVGGLYFLPPVMPGVLHLSFFPRQSPLCRQRSAGSSPTRLKAAQSRGRTAGPPQPLPGNLGRG